MDEFQLSGVPGRAPERVHSGVRAADGRLYFSDQFGHRIVVVNEKGSFLFDFGRQGKEQGEFWYPCGIALVGPAEDRSLAVCDSWNHRIQLFDLNGNWRGMIGSIGAGRDHFDDPVTIADGPGEGRMTVLDRGNNRLKVLSYDGKTLACYGRFGSPQDEFPLRLSAAALDPSSDAHAHRSPCFGYPLGMAVVDETRVAVADTNNHRIVVVGENGVVTGEVFLPAGTFPVMTIFLGDETLFVSGVKGERLLVNLHRSWETKRLPSDENPEIAVGGAIDDWGLVWSYDPKRIRSLLRLDADQATASIFKPTTLIPTDGNDTKRTLAWSAEIGAPWFQRAIWSGGDEIPSASSAFLQIATSSLRTIKEIEEGMAKTILELYALTEELKKTGSLSEHKEMLFLTMNRHSEVQQERKRWNDARFVYLCALWRLLRLTVSASEGMEEQYAALRALIDGEEATYEEDYRSIAQWLDESIAGIDSPKSHQYVAAVYGVYHCYYHLQYLAMAQKALYGGERNGLVREIEEAFGEALKEMDDDLTNLVGKTGPLLAAELRRRGYRQEAIGVYRWNDTKTGRERVYNRLEIATTFLELQDRENAFAELMRRDDEMPPLPSLYHRRAHLFNRMYMAAEARADFQMAVSLGGGRSDRLALAQCLRAEGAFEEAVPLFEALAGEGLADEVEEQARQGHATTLWALGDYEAALGILDAGSYKVHQVEAGRVCAMIRYERGEREEPRRLVTELLERVPENVSLILEAARQAALEKRGEEWKRIMGPLAEKRNAHLDYAVGAAYRMMGRYEEAFERYDSWWAAIRPNHLIAFERLAAALGMGKNGSVAEAEAGLGSMIRQGSPLWASVSFSKEREAASVELGERLKGLAAAEGRSARVEWRYGQTLWCFIE